MQVVEFRDRKVFADPDATRKAYSVLDADSLWCDCAYCRNIRPQLPGILGDELLALRQQLGVDAQKPLEAVQYGTEKDGVWLYSVIYHFVGETDAARPTSQSSAAQYNKDRLAQKIRISEKHSLLFSSAYFPRDKVFDGPNHPHLEIYISEVPWILEEKM
jgi:hypothetical protein